MDENGLSLGRGSRGRPPCLAFVRLSSDDDEGVDAASTAGIVVGVIAFLLLVSFALVYYRYRKDEKAVIGEALYPPLPRFDEFCANCREQGPALRKLASGQVVARDGHYPGLAAHAVWETPPKWLFGLRLQGPQIADEMSEVLFERARLRAEGGARFLPYQNKQGL